jgi:hypothetical protein
MVLNIEQNRPDCFTDTSKKTFTIPTQKANRFVDFPMPEEDSASPAMKSQ